MCLPGKCKVLIQSLVPKEKKYAISSIKPELALVLRVKTYKKQPNDGMRYQSLKKPRKTRISL